VGVKVIGAEYEHLFTDATRWTVDEFGHLHVSKGSEEIARFAKWGSVFKADQEAGQ